MLYPLSYGRAVRSLIYQVFTVGAHFGFSFKNILTCSRLGWPEHLLNATRPTSLQHPRGPLVTQIMEV